MTSMNFDSKRKYVVVTMEERIAVAMIITLLELSDGDKVKIVPFGRRDLIWLTIMANLISDKIKLGQIQARSDKERLPIGFFQTIKQTVLHSCQIEFQFSQDKRNVFSTILARVFAWKNGRIPVEIYERAKEYWPGINLAFNLQ